MVAKPDKNKAVDDIDVVLKRVRRSRRRGKSGILFIGVDVATGDEIRWWCAIR